ncbi:MAG: HEAT repeat domain-containing protein [Thermogutta sp.]|nr:HEAT repeat domain-containing protein [Thermogutta sp.]
MRCSRLTRLILAAALAAVPALAARGDIVVLKSGGRIVGEPVSDPQAGPDTVTLKPLPGVIVAVPQSEIEEHIRQRPAELEYEKIRTQYPDTVEGQWELAEWCREHNLRPQRETHLRRILELDPDNIRVRAILGYTKVNGEWKTREEVMREQGYVLYKGRWMLPQEVQILEERELREASERDWTQRIRRLVTRLDVEPGAAEQLQNIREPAAVKPLLKVLSEERRDPVRLLLVQILARIDSPEAKRALAVLAVEDPVEEIRLACLKSLAESKFPESVPYFIGRLRDNNNVIVNRAAAALKAMGDKTAIPALIDALVTTHRVVLPPLQSGSLGTTFSRSSDGRSATGLSAGGNQPRVIRRQVPNREVLEALVELSGQNFGYEPDVWKRWYAQERHRAALESTRPQ